MLGREEKSSPHPSLGRETVVISALTVETGEKPSLRPQLLRTLGKGGAYYLLRFGDYLIHVLITLEGFRVNLVDIFGT